MNVMYYWRMQNFVYNAVCEFVLQAYRVHGPGRTTSPAETESSRRRSANRTRPRTLVLCSLIFVQSSCIIRIDITSYIKVYVSDTEAVEACIRFVDDDDDEK